MCSYRHIHLHSQQPEKQSLIAHMPLHQAFHVTMFPAVQVYGLPQHMSSVHIQYLSLYFNQYSDTFYRHCCQAHIKSHSYIIAGSETRLHYYTLTLKKNVITSMKKWQKRNKKSKIPLPAHKLFFTLSTSTQSVPQGNSWSTFFENVLSIHHTGQTLHPATEIQLLGPVKQHINSKQFCARSDILTAITINNTVTWKATMLNCQQTTWQHTPENRILHKYFRYNEKVKMRYVCQWKQQ